MKTFKQAIASMRLNAAIRKYAQSLPGQLHKDYGMSEWYTPVQIKASVLRSKLSLEFICIGQAMYLPEPQFNEIDASEFAYQTLRSKFKSHVKNIPSAGHSPAAENSMVAGGANIG